MEQQKKKYNVYKIVTQFYDDVVIASDCFKVGETYAVSKDQAVNNYCWRSGVYNGSVDTDGSRYEKYTYYRATTGVLDAQGKLVHKPRDVMPTQQRKRNAFQAVDQACLEEIRQKYPNCIILCYEHHGDVPMYFGYGKDADMMRDLLGRKAQIVYTPGKCACLNLSKVKDGLSGYGLVIYDTLYKSVDVVQAPDNSKETKGEG